MSKKFIPSDLIEQAESVQDAWSRINSTMTVGDLNLAALITDIQMLRGVESDLVGHENQLVALRNQRDAMREAAWENLKRVRSVVRGIYGDDSSEYELIGGTRMSEKKPRRRAPVSNN